MRTRIIALLAAVFIVASVGLVVAQVVPVSGSLQVFSRATRMPDDMAMSFGDSGDFSCEFDADGDAVFECTGDLSLLTSLNLAYATASEAVAVDANGDLVSVAGVSDTEIGYVGDVTGPIQAQLDLLAPIDSPAFTTQMDISDWATASEALVTDASGLMVTLTGVSSTEVGYLDGVTSAIQTQLDAKIDDPGAVTDDMITTWDGITGTAVQDASIGVNDDGAFFTTDTEITFVTDTDKASKTVVAPIGYLSATEFQTAWPFSAFTSTGIEGGGQGVVGSADAYISLSDAADEINLGFTVPELASPADAADLLIEFDIVEDTDEECNIDIVIYEYGSAVAIVTDSITLANDSGRAWVGLDTAATGIGDVVDVGEFLVIEITATADTDQFKLYGARVTYLVGIQNDAS